MPNDIIIDGMLALKRLLRYELRLKLVVVGICLAAAAALIAAAYYSQTHLWSLFLGTAMVVLAITAKMLRDIIKEKPFKENNLVVLLHQSPQIFVWIYKVEINFAPAGIHLKRSSALIFKLTNSTDMQVRGNSKDIEKVEAALHLMLPHATFGFSKEREQWYIANPYLLWRE